MDVTSQYSNGGVKKIDVAIQCCFYDDVPKIDNMSQYSGNQGQFTDLTQYIDYRDHQLNNFNIHSVYPEHKAENLDSDCYGQNYKTTSSHYKNRHSLICEDNANPYILWNAQLRGRDLNVGCRSRHSRRREQKVNSTNQYSEDHKDNCQNTNQYCDRREQIIRSSHYQKGHSRQKTHTSLYHYSVCREQAKTKSNQNSREIESSKTGIRINSHVESELE